MLAKDGLKIWIYILELAEDQNEPHFLKVFHYLSCPHSMEWIIHVTNQKNFSCCYLVDPYRGIILDFHSIFFDL